MQKVQSRAFENFGFVTPFGMLATGPSDHERKWFAVFSLPQNEKSVVRRLDLLGIESYLPTYEVRRVWKNRQRVKVVLPLFPTYLFARLSPADRWQVLSSPGVVSIVGNSRGPVPIADAEIEFLQSDACRSKLEPFSDVLVGQRVRIKAGPMCGVEGVLVRKKGHLRFVLSLELINGRAALEIDAGDVEPVPCSNLSITA